MMDNKKKTLRRSKIRRRIRSSIRGTAERPRLCVFKSNKHIYAQLVDDFAAETLTEVSSNNPQIEKELKDKPGVEQAQIVGKRIAERALDKGIDKAVFDRSGYKYHGKIKALAESAREGGLDF